jgi:hypothetical protein
VPPTVLQPFGSSPPSKNALSLSLSAVRTYPTVEPIRRMTRVYASSACEMAMERISRQGALMFSKLNLGSFIPT